MVGTKVKCLADVVMMDSDKPAFKAGNTYKVKRVDRQDETHGPFYTMRGEGFIRPEYSLSEEIFKGKFVSV